MVRWAFVFCNCTDITLLLFIVILNYSACIHNIAAAYPLELCKLKLLDIP